ncbi:MAG TPA: vitamin B12-dependent ribonucleotide reductase [Patescibacteria group bacterium]|nr:vitamin B12-dependent ribonucleotide reductase [Patescibacteria group bacterium]
MSRKETSELIELGDIGQYGLPFGIKSEGESTLLLYPLIRKTGVDEEDSYRVDIRRILEIPPLPEDLPDPVIVERNRVVLEHRYLLKDETPKQLFWRVAVGVATADSRYGGNLIESAREFYQIMVNREFLPNSPTLMNTGTKLGQLSGCFVVPIEDDMSSINEARTAMTVIHKTGGGTGFNFSKLRPGESPLSTGGVSSGPLSFMEGFFDATTDVIRQGGKRRGANMGILNVDHPEIERFIGVKNVEGRLKNFNISVGLTKEFLEALRTGGEYDLVDPHTGKREKRDAREIFRLIVENAHRYADPGIVLLDRINEDNPTPKLGKIESTNPCGEQPLLPYESCNLGSINLAEMVEDGEVNWAKLDRVARTAVHFLDNVIDINKLPTPEIEEATKRTRKIGLGVMGFADMLILLGVRYDSEQGIKVAEEVMGFIQEKSHEASSELAMTRGPFPAYQQSVYAERGELMRNASVTTIAPAGSIAEIACCSSGIEPIFALNLLRRDDVTSERRRIIHPQFTRIVEEFNLSDEDIERIKNQGTLEGVASIPEELKEVIKTAHEIHWKWHVLIQAAFQRNIDNAVSKTINMPEEASVEDVWEAFMLAIDEGCKGVTVYRDGSKKDQVLSTGERERIETKEVMPYRQPRPRPEITTGKTEKIKLGCGQTIYITINEDEEGLFEVFGNMGKSGGCMASQSESVGRLISLALRSRVDPRAIIDQLKGIRCPVPTWDKGGQVLSCADAIGGVLERYLKEGELSATPSLITEMPPLGIDHSVMPDSNIPGSVEKGPAKNILGLCPDCPECGTMVEFAEGCLRCPVCGYSQCS